MAVEVPGDDRFQFGKDVGLHDALLKVSTTLWPPNPKDEVSAARAGRGGDPRDQVEFHLVRVSVRLRVPGIIPCRSASTVKMASTAPAAPSRWPVALGGGDGRVGADRPGDAAGLHPVARRGPGRMRVDVLDVGGGEIGVGQRLGDGADLARMSGLTVTWASALTPHPASTAWMCAPRARANFAFQHHHPGALGHDEPVPVLVEGA